MSLSLLSPLLSQYAAHLWQSTWCVAAAFVLTLALRRNRAAVRYWIWLAASIKFLVPFSLLVNLGHSVGALLTWQTPHVILRQQVSFVIDEISQPFITGTPAVSRPAPPPVLNWIPIVLACIWLCGVLFGIARWLRWQREIAATRRNAASLPLNLAIEVKSSPGRLEPGILGIWRPILLLPQGIADRLTPQQFEAVVAHELCHVRRRDNLTGAIHMIVETIFWFHPLVWWIRTRLLEERERACDEEVLRLGNAPMIYAEGILEVCKHYVESPLVCVSGISGAHLRKRVESIIEHPLLNNLSLAWKVILGSTGFLVLIAPIAAGIVNAPVIYSHLTAPAPVLMAQAVSPTQPIPAPAQAKAPIQHPVPASVPPEPPPHFLTAAVTPAGATPGPDDTRTYSGGMDHLDYHLIGLRQMLLTAYYPATPAQIVWPSSMDGPDSFYNLSVTFPNPTLFDRMPLMFQRLLADRFKLSAHWEMRSLQVYVLKVSGGGLKVPKSAVQDASHSTSSGSREDIHWIPKGPREAADGPSGMTIAHLIQAAAGRLDRPMVDMTGLEGNYNIDLSVPFDPAADPPRNPSASMAPFPNGWNNAVFVSALESQLGLNVEMQTRPTQVLVIDHLERVPTL